MIAVTRVVLTALFLMLPALLFAAEHKVTTANWVFHPVELVIKSGDRVTWVNDDDTMHNIFFEDESLKAPLEENAHKIREGKTFSFDFLEPGEYLYHCKNHKEHGMSGKIVVK